MQDLARPCFRQHQDFRIIADGVLEAWAEQQHLPLREVYQQVLAAGIFPESLERNFPTLSDQDQLRLFNSSVLIVGLGGLGGYQAQLLARLGVGRLLMADGDRFAPSNFKPPTVCYQRQPGTIQNRNYHRIFSARLIRLWKSNSLEEYLDSTNYPAILPRVDLALDALDTFMARRQLLIAAREAGKPVIHGAVLGQDGQITTILPGDNPVFESEYLNQPSLPAEHPPVVAPTVSLVASLQVQEAIRLLLYLPPAYHGSLVYLDGYTGRMDFFPLW